MVKKISAVIPAAGFSSRMGAFKPLLPLGDKTVIEASIDLFKESGLEDIIIVTGYRSHDIEKIVALKKVTLVNNINYQNGMFSSITEGLKHLQSGSEAFFLLPADIPAVRPATITQIITHYQSHDYQIVYPEKNGYRGHPPLISTDLIETISNWKGEGGLKECLKQLKHLSGCISISDQGTQMDMDFPEDYKNVFEFYHSASRQTLA